MLKEIPDESIHCVVTSPPFFGLRDYGTAKWQGGEAGCDHTGVARRCDKPGRTDKQSTQKGSPMPESVTDRCTKAHEYLFLLTKAERYYFDAAAIAEPVSQTDGAQAWRRIFDPTKQAKEEDQPTKHGRAALPLSTTAIPYRGKPAADGPRYKALGNSFAVNVMRWIGRRIQMVEGIE
jgi:hypothetical protein